MVSLYGIFRCVFVLVLVVMGSCLLPVVLPFLPFFLLTLKTQGFSLDRQELDRLAPCQNCRRMHTGGHSGHVRHCGTGSLECHFGKWGFSWRLGCRKNGVVKELALFCRLISRCSTGEPKGCIRMNKDVWGIRKRSLRRWTWMGAAEPGVNPFGFCEIFGHASCRDSFLGKVNSECHCFCPSTCQRKAW